MLRSARRLYPKIRIRNYYCDAQKNNSLCIYSSKPIDRRLITLDDICVTLEQRKQIAILKSRSTQLIQFPQSDHIFKSRFHFGITIISLIGIFFATNTVAICALVCVCGLSTTKYIFASEQLWSYQIRKIEYEASLSKFTASLFIKK